MNKFFIRKEAAYANPGLPFFVDKALDKAVDTLQPTFKDFAHKHSLNYGLGAGGVGAVGGGALGYSLDRRNRLRGLLLGGLAGGLLSGAAGYYFGGKDARDFANDRNAIKSAFASGFASGLAGR